MAARIFRSGSASESASLVVLDGAGAIGDSIGITTTPFITTTGITRGASRSTTGTVSTEGEACEAALTAPAAEFARGLPTALSGAAKFSTVPARRPGLSREAPRPLEDTLHHRVKAELVPVPSATMAMAGRQGPTRHAEAPALVAERVAAEGVREEGGTLAEGRAVAGAGNCSFVMIQVDREI